MPLAMEGTRVLSPLERDAVNLVFQGTIDPWDIALEVVEFINPQEQRSRRINLETDSSSRVAVSTYDGSGKIRINKSAFPHTQALNINSTRRYLDLTDKRGELTNQFRPGNMHYLSTLIHECTRYWQEEFRRHASSIKHPVYRFALKQLRQRDVPDLSPQQHASAVQIAFLVEWQLHYRTGSKVDLMSRSKDPRDNVGPVDRFHKIDERIKSTKYKGTIPPPEETAREKRILTDRQAHEFIASNFGWLLVELRYGWKAVCQGTDSFERNTRVRRGLPKKRRP